MSGSPSPLMSCQLRTVSDVPLEKFPLALQATSETFPLKLAPSALFSSLLVCCRLAMLLAKEAFACLS